MYRIFVDFDGTITLRDVGDSIFERFLPAELIDAGWHRKIIEEWKAGRVSSMECLTRECAEARVTQEELDAELNTHTLIPGFAQLKDYCQKGAIPLEILSDGLDYYIAFILEKYGMSTVPFRANHMYFTKDSIGVEFPYEDKGCGRCGNCKRWHMESVRREGEKIVYIGDGYSDRYAVSSADIVFAHRDLAEFCNRNHVPFIPFGDFFGVVEYLENGIGNV